jgi:hypothetical protein
MRTKKIYMYKENIFLHLYNPLILIYYKIMWAVRSIFNCADDGDWKLVEREELDGLTLIIPKWFHHVFDSLPNVFSMEKSSRQWYTVGLAGLLCGRAICFRIPLLKKKITSSKTCWFLLFILCADSKSGRAKSLVGEDPVDYGTVQETSTIRR